MKYICDEYKLQTGEIKILCDCKGTLTRSVVYNNRPTTRHPNYDLLWSIFDLQDNLEIDVNWEHVKGHQDNANLDQELTHFEKSNYEVDAGAKEYLRFVQIHEPKPITELYGSQWRIQSSTGYAYKNFNEQIYMSRHGYNLRNHVKNKQGYTESIMESIDWMAIGKVGKQPLCQ